MSRKDDLMQTTMSNAIAKGEAKYFILDCEDGSVMPGALPDFLLAEAECMRLNYLHSTPGLARFNCWDVEGPPPTDVRRMATARYLDLARRGSPVCRRIDDAIRPV